MAADDLKKGEKLNFSMKMPDWFIDELSVEKKNVLIDRMTDRIKTKAVNFHELSYDQLKKREFRVKEPSS